MMAQEAFAIDDYTADTPADVFFELGMRYAVGRDVARDMVLAHKWMNIAARKGSRPAAARRAEFADEMTPSQVAAAQRAAREFLQLH